MRGKGEKKNVERATLLSLYNFQKSDRRFPAKQEGKSFIVTRDASRD